MGTVSLGSHPESFQFDETAGRVYANVPKQLVVAVIDPKKRSVVAKWPLGLSFANYPMALDQANRRLFVACRLPARLVILNTNSGQIIQTLGAVGDVDEVFYDEKRRFIYIIGGDGASTFFGSMIPTITSPRAERKQRLELERDIGGRSSNRLYVAAPAKGGQEAAVLVYAVSGAATK